MNIQMLQEFVTLSRHLKLQTAANELFVSAPTLSQHIAALEKELGILLFNRKGGLSLTYEGETALEISQRMLHDYRQLTGIAAKRDERIRIRIPRYAVGLDEFLLARTSLQAKQPDRLISIETNELQMSDPIAILREGKSDVSLMYIVNSSGMSVVDHLPAEGDIAYFPFKAIKREFVSELTHPLASKDVLSMEDFEGATVVASNCPLSFVDMEGVKRFFALNGVSMDYITRQVNRHDDIFAAGLDGCLAYLNEASAYNVVPLHRYKLDFVLTVVAYILYRPADLSDLQLEYLREVERLCTDVSQNERNV